jgi:hypothetical protein
MWYNYFNSIFLNGEFDNMESSKTDKRLGRDYPEYERNPADMRKLMPGVPRKTQLVREMNERHHEIARMVVLGYKNAEIAKDLNISQSFVSTVRNAPPVKEKVAILAGARDAGTVDIAKQIQMALPTCIKYLSETIPDDDISDSLKSRNAFGLMAIGGHGPSKNLNVRGVHAVLTADDIKEIRENAQNIAVEIGIMEKEA